MLKSKPYDVDFSRSKQCHGYLNHQKNSLVRSIKCVVSQWIPTVEKKWVEFSYSSVFWQWRSLVLKRWFALAAAAIHHSPMDVSSAWAVVQRHYARHNVSQAVRVPALAALGQLLAPVRSMDKARVIVCVPQQRQHRRIAPHPKVDWSRFLRLCSFYHCSVFPSNKTCREPASLYAWLDRWRASWMNIEWDHHSFEWRCALKWQRFAKSRL